MSLKAPNMLEFQHCGLFGRGDLGPKHCWYSLRPSNKKWGGFACSYNGWCIYAGRGTLVSDDGASSSAELRSEDGRLDGKSRKELAPLPKPLSVTDLTASPKHGVQVRVACQGVPGAYSEAAALGYSCVDSTSGRQIYHFDVSSSSRGASFFYMSVLGAQSGGMCPFSSEAR